ncbi:hypothetical protein BT96DRAFT_836620 [Gymnopus androsaceus JB14]|uniref:DUF659 domain-containing protein n=1 Tax=Gymnopus androsaceus JB14 TaxID=1447944 RepID=A0A6A4GRB7_9AGAR|nr:hypothetical protein BT96DRAFT_836620 [Gymnopus androsaceus JB14]
MNIYNSVVMARWVAESARPFQVIADHRYQWLQHAGCPEHYIPSQETVGRDVKALFNKTKETIAEELQEYDGEIAIMLDTWKSPNHCPFMSIMGSWLRKGKDGKEELITH